MKRASSDAAIALGPPGAGSGRARIVPAEALGRVEPVWLGSLAAPAARPAGSSPSGAAPTLRARDLDTEVGRAAYQLGRRRGLAEGHARGLREGLDQAEAGLAGEQEARLAASAEALSALAASFQDELATLEATLADEVTQLALAIARQVLRRELPQPETVQAVAREALQGLAGEAGAFELQVNPAQAQMLGPWLAAQAPSAAAGLSLRPDPAIAPGGCRLVAATGEVDATVGTRWLAVLDRLGWPQEAAP